jgi:hypothetical protein
MIEQSLFHVVARDGFKNEADILCDVPVADFPYAVYRRVEGFEYGELMATTWDRDIAGIICATMEATAGFLQIMMDPMQVED